MATKKELEKALDVVEDIVEAKDDKSLAKAVKAADKFEGSVKDKELAAQVNAIAEAVETADEKEVDKAAKTDKVEASNDDLVVPTDGSDKKKMAPEEHAKFVKEKLKTLPGRVIIPE